MLAGNYRQKRKLKALPDSRDAALLAELEAVKVLVGVNDKVRICIKEGVETTFLTRMRGQYVIALESGFDAAERRQVLLHELTHLKHGDLGGNQSAALILAICWWNPVIWRTTNLSYGVLSGARTRETAHLQQTESPLCILGTRTLEELGAEDAAQADTDYTFTYYLTGTRGGAVRNYIRRVDSTLGQGWIDCGSQT